MAAVAQTDAVPIVPVAPAGLQAAFASLDEKNRRFAEAQGFGGEPGALALLPDPDGRIGKVLFGFDPAGPRGPMAFGKLARSLPEGLYRLDGDAGDSRLAALAFALGSYRFDRYKTAKKGGPRLQTPAGVDAAEVARTAEAVFLARDLINRPANDLGPVELAEAARLVAERYGATFALSEGEALETGFPLVHAVGASSERPPRLVDFTWGDPHHPKVTLVGKGVVFDTGGLDIKPAAGMALMKKDMGGAANALALAQMVMGAELPVRLRVLIPAVENAVSGRAFRPGDVFRSRKGLSVEIGNTDAEGRLILADALAFADEEAPDLLVTMATLTGAARVALGPDLPAFFTDSEDFAARLAEAARTEHDPLWRLPLWPAYDEWLSSKVADLNHIAGNAFAGSIVAALFLKRFVSNAKRFAHFDMFAWNPTPKPYGPEGGEAQAIRALHALLKDGGTLREEPA